MENIISVPGIPNAISVDCKGSLTLTKDYTICIKQCIADRVVAIKDKTIEIPKEYKNFYFDEFHTFHVQIEWKYSTLLNENCLK